LSLINQLIWTQRFCIFTLKLVLMNERNFSSPSVELFPEQ